MREGSAISNGEEIIYLSPNVAPDGDEMIERRGKSLTLSVSDITVFAKQMLTAVRYSMFYN